MVGSNEDLDLSAETGLERPKTAPVKGGASGDDWPATSKEEQITRLSQQMRNITDENVLAKAYK